MARRKTTPQPPMERLSAHLLPQPEWGPLLGFVTTTYELDPDFLDGDWLPTVLGVDGWSDRSRSGALKVERALSELDVATVLLDARTFRGRPRSLRVEVVPAIGPRGRPLHAKVTLLLHTKAVRLLIGSANLTDRGYRRNREVVADLVVTPDDAVLADVVRAGLQEMPTFLEGWWTRSAEDLRQLAMARCAAWSTADAPRVEVLWSGAGVRLWETLLDRLPEHRPIDRLDIVSPFWSDEPEGALSRLFRRIPFAAKASVRLITGAAPVRADRQVLPQLPKGLAHWRPRVPTVVVAADPLDETVGSEGIAAQRALHAKAAVFVPHDHPPIAYIGSANCTLPGWGLLRDAKRGNVECGVLVHGVDPFAVLPPTRGPEIPMHGTADLPEGAEESESDAVWPTFLTDLRLVATDRVRLRATVDDDRVEGAWFLRHDGVIVPTDSPLPPETFAALLQTGSIEVRWWGGSVAFPLNVDANLRHLLPMTLDGSRPDEAHLLAYYLGQLSWEDTFGPDPLFVGEGDDADEASAVDTSQIQSYRVRAFVEALPGIRADLEAATASPRTMRLALTGPVSPASLARALVEASALPGRTVTAAGFQLVELLTVLQDVRDLPVEDEHAALWLASVDAAVEAVTEHLDGLEADAAFVRYRQTVLA